MDSGFRNKSKEAQCAGELWTYARVAELVDALDLGSSIERCESSSLSFRTILPTVPYWLFVV